MSVSGGLTHCGKLATVFDISVVATVQHLDEGFSQPEWLRPHKCFAGNKLKGSQETAQVGTVIACDWESPTDGQGA
jgi:hypothetical protein